MSRLCRAKVLNTVCSFVRHEEAAGLLLAIGWPDWLVLAPVLPVGAQPKLNL
jgi:hypothetical protein